jgi:ABC-type nitrate/sulfonate/bicarbonate transport system substrate-binding protein
MFSLLIASRLARFASSNTGEAPHSAGQAIVVPRGGSGKPRSRHTGSGGAGSLHQQVREEAMKREADVSLSRRTLLRGVGGTALAMAYPDMARAAREIRIADTTAIHEMSVYAMPEFLDAAYSVKQFNFGAAGTSAIAAMSNGMCDAMSNANSYLVAARAEGANIVAVCGVAGRGQAIVAREDRGINRLEDLKGKKLVTKRMTSSHVMLQIALRAAGMDPAKDVEILDIGQPAGFTLSLERGEADAGQLWEPFPSIAASRPGIRKLELDRFFQLTWVTHSSLFVTQKLIDTEPKLVRDLVAANIAAIHALKADRAKFLALTTKNVGQTPDVLNAALDNCDPRVDMDSTMFYRVAEEMYGLGMIRKDVSAQIEPAINYKFVSELTGKSAEQLGYISYAEYKSGKKSALL